MKKTIALKCFNVRTIKENNIKVKHQEYIEKEYNRIYKNETKSKIINKFFDNKKMLIVFPRLTVQDINGNIIYIKDLYPKIKTHFYELK